MSSKNKAGHQLWSSRTDDVPRSLSMRNCHCPKGVPHGKNASGCPDRRSPLDHAGSV